MFFPQYEKSILSVIASILTYYQIEPPNGQTALSGFHISKEINNIILMIFDGMGADIISTLDHDSFVCRNRITDISSVYPCTTTAATRSIYSGLPPISHGYLGWNCYFKECGRNIAVLKDQDFFTGESINIVKNYLSFESILELIHEKSNGKIHTHHLMPGFAKNGSFSLDEVAEKLITICRNNTKNFIILYWDLPDALMHLYGPQSVEAKKCLNDIDNFLRRITIKVKKTAFVITADHGMRNIKKCVAINEESELMECLYMPPALEYRAMSLYVKPHKIDKFVDIFMAKFGDKYVLLPRRDVFDNHLFGEGIPHKKIDDFVGDYLACGVGDELLYYLSPFQKNALNFKGHHSGLTREEMLIPLVYFES